MSDGALPTMPHVRAIGVDSLAEVEGIMARAFDPAYGEAWNSAQCLSVFAFPGYQFLGAFDNDSSIARLQGFAITRTIAGESELLLLATDPACQNKGVGRSLILYWLETCRAAHETLAFLEVRYDNPARHLYDSMDFRDTAVRPGYYRGHDGQLRDAITMQKRLD